MRFKKIIIVVILVLLLSACGKVTKKPLNQNHNNQDNKTIQNLKHRKDGNSLLGLASFKEFEPSKKSSSRKLMSTFVKRSNISNNTNDEVKEYLTYSYPFDYVKIHQATKFDLYIPEDCNSEALEEVIAKCGLGNLEVTIASFTTYIIDEDDYNYNSNVDEILPSVTDTLISFKGSRGFYTILNNSFSLGNELNYDNGHQYFLFSSHKTITSLEIEKNFEPPIYCVQLEITDEGNYYIAFNKDDHITSIGDFYNDSNLNHFNVDTSTIVNVSRDTLYDIYELTTVPEEEQTVQIVAIDIEQKKLEVLSDGVLSIVYLDEYTIYYQENIESNNLWNDLTVGGYIKITYDCYFDGYEPIEVYANSLTIEDFQQ